MVFLSFIICFLSCDRQQNETKVYLSNRLKGFSFRLFQGKFKFIYEKNNSIDSTTGTVEKLNDTLVLKYDNEVNDRRPDTIDLKDRRKIGGFVSIASIFSPRQLMRPAKLLIQGDTLFYLDSRTNRPLNSQQLLLKKVE